MLALSQNNSLKQYVPWELTPCRSNITENSILHSQHGGIRILNKFASLYEGSHYEISLIRTERELAHHKSRPNKKGHVRTKTDTSESNIIPLSQFWCASRFFSVF
jgi:hypothetical protein